jgi:hypothetical protein
MGAGGPPEGFGAAAASLTDPSCRPGQAAFKAAKAENEAILEKYNKIMEEYAGQPVSLHYCMRQCMLLRGGFEGGERGAQRVSRQLGGGGGLAPEIGLFCSQDMLGGSGEQGVLCPQNQAAPGGASPPMTRGNRAYRLQK